MARKAKDANGGIGHNQMTEDQKRALHYEHCRKYEGALALKKKADADLKNVGKMIKADGDSVAKVKKTLLSRTPEGEAELRAALEETAEVLRWSGVCVGEQADLFPPDRTPTGEVAYATGKRHGLAGDKCEPPYAPELPQYEEYMRGWHDGQTVLAQGWRPFPQEQATA